MDPLLAEALEIVLRDVRATSGVALRLEDRGWDPDRPSVMLWDLAGSGTGIALDPRDPPAARLALLAEQVQEMVIETRWEAGLPTNWPPCPDHPGTHPLGLAGDPAGLEHPPWWACERSGRLVARVGELLRPTGDAAG